MKLYRIYLATTLGHWYVGSTTMTIERRMHGHFSVSGHSQLHALRKAGWVFDVDLLEECAIATRDAMLAREHYWFEQMKIEQPEWKICLNRKPPGQDSNQKLAMRA